MIILISIVVRGKVFYRLPDPMHCLKRYKFKSIRVKEYIFIGLVKKRNELV